MESTHLYNHIRTVSVMSQHLTEPLDATENSLSPSGDNDSPLILQERSKTNHESVQSRKVHTEKEYPTKNLDITLLTEPLADMHGII